MIWLANILVALVTGIVQYFGMQLSKKAVFATAAVTAFLTLTSACILVIKGLAMGIVASLPAWMAPSIGMLIPSNMAACIGALVGAKIAVAIYRYHVETLKLVSFIT